MRVALGYHQYTLATVKDLTDGGGFTIPVGSRYVTLVAEAQAVRWRDDGVAPTATVGQLLVVGMLPFDYWGKLTALQFIAAAGGAILNATFYK